MAFAGFRKKLGKRLNMIENRGSFIDRRSGIDRRRAHNPNYFLKGGVERRSFKERRSQVERRKHWVRVDEWVSVFVGNWGRLRSYYTNLNLKVGD
jgi:hypothetical protein